MRKFVLIVTCFTIISEVLAALPCDSRLRKTRPDLFKHCGNTCPYGQWGSWSITSKFRTDQCNSSKAYNQTRSRYSFIKTCPSKSENKTICQPTIEEKALLFIKALDLGIKPSTTPPATKSPSTQNPTQPPITRKLVTTQRPTTRRPSPTTQRPTTRRPSSTTQRPTTQSPPPTTQRPTTRRPSSTTQRPTTRRPTQRPTTRRPSPTTQRPTTRRRTPCSTICKTNSTTPRPTFYWPTTRFRDLTPGVTPPSTVPIQFPSFGGLGRKKRQMQQCPSGVHKICEDNTKRNRKSTQSLSLLKEVSNYYKKLQSVPIIDNSIIPEPFDLKYYLNAAQAHRRKRRMSSNRRCNSTDRYLLFMLDTSGSIGSAAFTRMTTKLSELVFYFCGNTKIAAMTFGSHIYHEFCFNCKDINREDQILDAIKNIPYHGGLTHTGEALKCACDNILTIPCGLPKRRKYRKCPAPIDIVMITDGHSNGQLDACEEAKCLHNHPFYDISTFSIGVGNNINEVELDCIKNLDSDDLGHIFFDVDSFDELEELIGKVIEYLSTPIDDDPSSGEETYHKCYDLDNPLNDEQ